MTNDCTSGCGGNMRPDFMKCDGLKGRDKINDIPVCTLISYPGA